MNSFKLIFLVILISLASCNNNKVIITEEDLNSDMFCLKGDMKPYTGTCYILFRNSENVKYKFTYLNGRLNGKAFSYYDNGKIKSQGIYNNNNMAGKWEFWNEQGNKTYIVNFRNDSVNGEFISYYINGNMKEKGAYQNNNRKGDWNYYTQNGQLLKKVSY